MFVLKSKVNVVRPSIVVLVLICIVCAVRWPFATGRGKGKPLAQRVCKLTCFTHPECWTGIEKEIVYIQMLATRCLLFLPPCFPITEET